MACDIDILKQVPFSGYLTMTSSPFIGFTLLSATVMQLLVPRKQRLPRPGRRQAAGFGFAMKLHPTWKLYEQVCEENNRCEDGKCTACDAQK